jgi:hypothetical protein
MMNGCRFQVNSRFHMEDRPSISSRMLCCPHTKKSQNDKTNRYNTDTQNTQQSESNRWSSVSMLTKHIQTTLKTGLALRAQSHCSTWTPLWHGNTPPNTRFAATAVGSRVASIIAPPPLNVQTHFGASACSARTHRVSTDPCRRAPPTSLPLPPGTAPPSPPCSLSPSSFSELFKLRYLYFCLVLAIWGAFDLRVRVRYSVWEVPSAACKVLYHVTSLHLTLRNELRFVFEISVLF